jgi:hypothetical protein
MTKGLDEVPTLMRDQKQGNSDGQEAKYHCSVCGREISEEDYEDYDGMCWECWDDQLTEESEDMFGNVM